MAKIIVLNAPPRAGKDTIAAKLCGKYNVLPGMFKRSMFEIAKAILGHESYATFLRVYETDAKDTDHLSILGGMTCREFMIWISEDVIKPKFGKRHFGDMSAEHLHFEGGNTYVFSDGGFPDEVEALLDAGHQVNIFRLHRTGFDFSKDSRDYIILKDRWGGGQLTECDLRLVPGNPDVAVQDIAELCDLIEPDFNDDIPW